MGGKAPQREDPASRQSGIYGKRLKNGGRLIFPSSRGPNKSLRGLTPWGIPAV